MQSIRDDFINKITQSAISAVGAWVIMQFGIIQHQQYTQQYPNAPISMGSGPPYQANTRIIKYSPTHKKALEILQNNENLIFELYLTEIVQYWFDFLRDIYTQALSANLSGTQKYQISGIKIEINSSLTGANVNRYIIDEASRNFGFAQEKLKLISNPEIQPH